MRNLAPALVLALAMPANAATIMIDFDDEPAAVYSNAADPRVPAGFLSSECGCVFFTEQHGGDLVVAPEEGDRMLGVGQEGGSLLMTFLVPVISLALDFGGDSPNTHVEAFPAQLMGLDGGVVVASASLAPNRDRLVNQTLVITSDVALDQALFVFTQFGETEPLSPIVDNIRLETTVPEPGTLALGALAAAFLASRRLPRASSSTQ